VGVLRRLLCFFLVPASLLAWAAQAADGATVQQMQERPAHTKPLVVDAHTKERADRIRADVAFLADDLLRGRLAGSSEYEIAARYVAAQMRAIGLHPIVSNYLQTVPIRRAWLHEPSAQMTLHIPGRSATDLQLEVASDFIMSGNAAHLESRVTAPLVFAGFGVRAPDLEHDDYANIDAQGKIVVVLSGTPGTVLKDSARSEQWAHYGSLKAQNAVEAGAVGIIVVHTPRAEQIFGWERRAAHREDARVRWLAADGIPHRSYPQLKGSAYVAPHIAEKLFSRAPLSYDKVLNGLKDGRLTEGFELGLTATIGARSRHEDLGSSNVLGVLPGSDPDLAHEYVVVTAHLDHIGVTEKDGVEEVNNGAIDNAMGVALMLETARMLSSRTAPARSVVFVALTAEEAGLLGADYLAQNPPRAMRTMVANVNLDGPMLLYPFASLIGFGAQHSSLGEVAEAAVAAHGVRLQPDPLPEQGLFTRSDHYMFVRQGVPSIFLVPGFDSQDPALDGREQFLGYLAGPYHSPQDDMSLPIVWPSAVLMAQINAAMLDRIANAQAAPHWYEGNFFGDTFGSSDPEKNTNQGRSQAP